MYGAIIGDIVGSPFEFDRGKKTKKFELFTEYSHFTDDTVMTVAIADALIYSKDDISDDELEKEIVKSMQHYGSLFPRAGYGGMFHKWLHSKEPKPYNSYGNGSAMRVSSVGWLYDTIERTREVAKLTAKVTHNHPEGIKGAEAVASAIFLARNKKSKKKIKEYIKEEFGYNLSRTCEQIRPTYHHVETCQETVPEAIICFLESKNFEDAIRNAISLGGDTDTIGAITGSIAEAYYGIPIELLHEAKIRIPLEFAEILRHCYGKEKERIEKKQSEYKANIHLQNKHNIFLELSCAFSIILNFFIQECDSSIILHIMTCVLCCEWIRREFIFYKANPIHTRFTLMLMYIGMLIMNIVNILIYIHVIWTL